jgi:hypothetical protein
MSPDHEDTALEEALRDDLPSPETSARVRRRLLAAGLAVGNGVAVTTAAAAGATPGVAAGLVGKGLALSWGFKLGALAVVAIPTVGLLVETSAEPQLAPPPPSAAAPSHGSRGPSPAPNDLSRGSGVQDSPDQVEPAPQTERSLDALPQAAAPIPRLGSERSVTTEALPARPSQVDFATPEAAAAARASSTLAEETRILDSAFAELAGGNAAQAALLIAEHERRFPAGLLQKERERAKARLGEVYRGE